MKESQIRCTLDQMNPLPIEDPSIRGFGRVGLWSKSDAQTHLDDFTATGPMIPLKLAEPAAETREFEIRHERAFLGGREVDLWGLRCGNGRHFSWYGCPNYSEVDGNSEGGFCRQCRTDSERLVQQRRNP